MSAVEELEQPVTEIAPEPPAWEAPMAKAGQIVNWYEGDRSSASAILMMVFKPLPGGVCMGRLLDRPQDNIKTSARHVSDPSIAERNGDNVRGKHQGRWDFTDEDKRRWAWEREIRAVLSDFDDRMAKLEAKNEGADDRELRILRQRASELKMKVPPNISLENLRKNVADMEAAERCRPKD